MAVYSKLLYSAGGGIINRTIQDNQNGSAMIAIGLGGTGKDCLKYLKREIYQRIMPDNPGEAVPKYSHIRFLCVDTDSKKLRDEGELIGLDERSEFKNIGGDVGQLIEHIPMLRSHPYGKWVSDDLAVHGHDGAGGNRQVGRYFLLSHSAEILQDLQQMLTDVVRELSGNVINIHMLTGLGGGTGSGTFLDMCYIVRHAVSICPACAGKTVNICGYFFLPDVNLSNPEISAKVQLSGYIRANSFAVMKELDHCMDFVQNGDHWNQSYDGFSVDTNKTPVDLAHLISAQALNGRIQNHAYQYAMRAVCEYILQFIADTTINMDSHIVNYNRTESNLKKPHGGNYKYVILGASHSVLPLREISTYLASALFEKIMATDNVIPTDVEVDAFANTYNLTTDKLMWSLGTHQFQIPELEYRDFSKLPTDDSGAMYSYAFVLPKAILDPFHRQEERFIGKIKTNMEAMLNYWNREEPVNENSASVSAKIAHALEGFIADATKGPLYAEALLCGVERKNLINVLTGIEKEIDTALENSDNLDICVKNVRSTRRVYNDAILGKEDKFKEFLSSVKNYMETSLQLEKLRMLKEAVSELKTQIRKLHDEYFHIYADVIRSLKTTFAADKIAIGELQDINADPFELPLFKISDIRLKLDDIINSMNMETIIQDFNTKFLREYEIWHSGNEDKISKWIIDDMSVRFSQQTGKSIDEYLRDKYPQITDDSKLIQKIEEEILNDLNDRASELFVLDKQKADHLNSNKYCYIAAHGTQNLIDAAISNFVGKNASFTSLNGMKDRIFILKTSPCVPLFAYALLDQLFGDYSAANSAGMHLYEGTPEDMRNWKALPNLRPYSIYPDSADIESVSAYGKAEDEKYGIVHPMYDVNGVLTKDYYIWLTPDAEKRIEMFIQDVFASDSLTPEKLLAMDETAFIELAKKIQDKEGKKADVDAKVLALRQYFENLIDFKLIYETNPSTRAMCLIKPQIPPVRIPNDSQCDETKPDEAEIPFRVRRDHVLDSVIWMNLIKDELKKTALKNNVLAAAEKFSTALSRVIGSEQDEQKYMNVFLQAVYTGVITYSRKISYEKIDEYGFTIGEAVELTGPKVEPYGRTLPLYQAFVSFSALSKEQKKIIADDVTERLDKLADEDEEVMRDVKDNCKMLADTFDKDFLDAMRENAETTTS